MDTFGRRCLKFMMNEIEPRAKRLGLSPAEFCPPEVAAAFVRLEESGEATRSQTRQQLDEITEKIRTRHVVAH